MKIIIIIIIIWLVLAPILWGTFKTIRSVETIKKGQKDNEQCSKKHQ